MATIVLTSISGHQQHQPQSQTTLASLHCRSNSKRGGYRDVVDICVAILKALLKYSKISHIRQHIKIDNTKHLKLYIAMLCRFGLMTEVAAAKRNVGTYRHRKTGLRGSKTIKRYYITPKGHSLIRLYDIMVEELTTFLR
jgi:predicted transcriptional regulator